MHYVITGSLGHTGKPVTEGLLAAGHAVTVVSSDPTKAAAIEALGARAAIGTVEDQEFVHQAFAGAAAVYLLLPTPQSTDDWRAFQHRISDNYAGAIRAHGIPKVVLLSSVGAHLGQDTGPVDGLHDAEQKLNALASGVSVVHLRPTYFMYNLLNMIGLLKAQGIVGSNFGGEGSIALTHTADVADAALAELLAPGPQGHRVRYLTSDERTGPEIARVLGTAVGRPETPWVEFSDEQSTQGMRGAGLNAEMAFQFTQLGEAMRAGRMQADYLRHRPGPGNVKLEQFAEREFAPAYRH